jgi:hypothetical protein
MTIPLPVFYKFNKNIEVHQKKSMTKQSDRTTNTYSDRERSPSKISLDSEPNIHIYTLSTTPPGKYGPCNEIAHIRLDIISWNPFDKWGKAVLRQTSNYWLNVTIKQAS